MPHVNREEDSLFVPMADDDEDQRWDPPEERDNDEAMLGWDGSGANDFDFRATFTDAKETLPHQGQQLTESGEQGILPTQRASQVKSLFD